MPISFLPAGEWLPDGLDRDSPSLDIAKNVLPVYRSYRPIPELVQHSLSPNDAGDPKPVTGGISHLVDASQSYQFIRPDGDAEVDPQYWSDDGTQTSLYLNINGTDPSFLDFILARNSNSAQVYRATFDSPLLTPPDDDDHRFSWQYLVYDPNSVGWNITMELLQGGSALSTPVTKTVTGTGSKESTYDEIILTTTQAAAITDYTDLQLRLTGWLDSAAVTVRNYPDFTVSNGGWNNNGSANAFHECVDDISSDTNPNEVIFSGGLTTTRDNIPISFRIASITDPLAHENHSLEIRARGVTAACQVLVQLHGDQGDQDEPPLISSNTFTLTTSFQNLTSALSSTEIGNISSYKNLTLTVTAIRTSTNTDVEVSAVNLTTPQLEGVVLGWSELRVSHPDSQFQGDILKRYVGIETKLYEIVDNSASWTDVSKGAGYVTSTLGPQSWSFTPWGDELIASNFADAIQILTAGGANFADLVTSTIKPRGKYVYAVARHLCIAGIDPASDSRGKPDLVRWSSENNAAIFLDADLATQSSFQRLRETAGQITGAVGGEWGTLFKRNSIYRQDYLGPPFTFGFPLLSHTIGTSYPRSIVAVGADIYFWSNGGIYVIRNGQQLDPVRDRIGDGKVLRFLFDTRFEDDSVDQASSSLDTELDSTVIGTYAPYSHTIWWLYRYKGQAFHRGTRLLIYSIAENRFTQATLTVPSGTLTEFDMILGEANTLDSTQRMTKDIIVFSWETTGSSLQKHASWTPDSATTLATQFRSQVLSGEYISNRKGEPHSIQINEVRPLYRTGSGSSVQGEVLVTLRASDRPEMSNLRTKTASSLTRNRAGWYPVEDVIAGAFFDWQVDFPVLINETIREFLGLYVDYTDLGSL